MTDSLTDAVARLKQLQADVERLQAGQDEAGEPRLFFSESEIAVAVETARIIRDDILERDTAVLDDTDGATLTGETVAPFNWQESGDSNGWGSLEYPDP